MSFPGKPNLTVVPEVKPSYPYQITYVCGKQEVIWAHELVFETSFVCLYLTPDANTANLELAVHNAEIYSIVELSPDSIDKQEEA